MDAFMLEGWTPIIIIGIGFAVVFFILSRKISRKALFSASAILSLICLGVVIYSVIGVGGWEGMGLGAVTVTVFLGIWAGTIIGAVVKSR